MNVYLIIIALIPLGFFTKWAWEIAFRELDSYKRPPRAMHDDRFLPPPTPPKQSAAKHLFWFAVAIAGTVLCMLLLWPLRTFIQ
jgi:hypothetical protein